jgi:hypothetical protein
MWSPVLWEAQEAVRCIVDSIDPDGARDLTLILGPLDCASDAGETAWQFTYTCARDGTGKQGVIECAERAIAERTRLALATALLARHRGCVVIDAPDARSMANWCAALWPHGEGNIVTANEYQRPVRH